MSAPARLAAFAVAALLALGGGAAIDVAVGPVDEPAPAPTPTPTRAPHGGMVDHGTSASGVR